MPLSCPQCGAQNADSAMSCYACGYTLSTYGQGGGYGQPQSGYGQPQQGGYGQPQGGYGQPQQGGYGQPQQGGYGQPQGGYGQQPFGQPANPYATPPSYGTPAAYGQYGSGYGGVGLTKADPGKRFLAFLIDSVAITAAMLPGYILVFIAAQAESGPLMLLGYLLLLAAALGLGLYQIYTLGLNGTTIGKRLMGLKCVGPDGSPLGFGKAFLREFVKNAVSQFTCGLGLGWLLFDKDKQQIYDKIFNTNVYHQ